MTDAQTLAWLDQQDAWVAQTIRKHGQCIQLVTGGPGNVPPTFAYTVGLFGLGHPELVILSCSSRTAGGVLDELADRVRAGEDFVPGQILTFERWPHRVAVELLPNPGQILFAANRHYQRPDAASVPAFQLTYDDIGGRFPWDAGYAHPQAIQPRPGTWRA